MICFLHFGSMLISTFFKDQTCLLYVCMQMASIGCGIPSNEKQFWDSITVKELYSLYDSLSATPEKVLAILDEPIEENSTQATVFGYLELYVGNMKNEEARCFLRYTTGSISDNSMYFNVIQLQYENVLFVQLEF